MYISRRSLWMPPRLSSSSLIATSLDNTINTCVPRIRLYTGPYSCAHFWNCKCASEVGSYAYAKAVRYLSEWIAQLSRWELTNLMNITQNRQCWRPWRKVRRPPANTTQPSYRLKNGRSAYGVDENTRCTHFDNANDECKWRYVPLTFTSSRNLNSKVTSIKA